MLFRRIIQITVFCFFYSVPLYAQFGQIEVTFDEQLLKSNIRQFILPLRDEVKRFYSATVWNEEFSDLNISLNIHFVFEGVPQKGSNQTFLAQALFSNGSDLRFFDKGVQFIYNDSGTLYYDPVIFDPLASFLSFYGNLILAGEIDTYTPEGGTSELEMCRSIAIRGNASDYPRGWMDRIQLINELSTNSGLRKARFSFYYAVDLFRQGEIETSISEFRNMIVGLDEVYKITPRNHHTLMFLKVHADTLTRVLTVLAQKDILMDLTELDPDNEKTYTKGLEEISE